LDGESGRLTLLFSFYLMIAVRSVALKRATEGDDAEKKEKGPKSITIDFIVISGEAGGRDWLKRRSHLESAGRRRRRSSDVI
jgi:hypothetical protein